MQGVIRKSGAIVCEEMCHENEKAAIQRGRPNVGPLQLGRLAPTTRKLPPIIAISGGELIWQFPLSTSTAPITFGERTVIR